MQVKINTKEKFCVLTPQEPYIYDNMAAELAATCRKQSLLSPKNIILNLSLVESVDEATVVIITKLQQEFYEQSTSFVICCMLPNVEAIFEKAELLELLNITPTESEAWDIIQMEEIERELMDTNDFGFDVTETEE